MPTIRKAARRDAQRLKTRMSTRTSRAFLLILDEQNAKRDRAKRSREFNPARPGPQRI